MVKRLQKHLSPIYSQEMLRTPKNSNLPPGMLAPSPHNGRNSSGPSSVVSQRPAQICMWGLVAMEDIPAGAFLMEYQGEIVTKKQGDMRGTYYDSNGLSYLFDMNDPPEGEEREKLIQKAYHGEFFPLCLDSMFYGNEARFINHSCDPNVQSFNLTGQVDSITYHSIGLFTSRKIFAGEELCLDYQWDKNDLTIAEDVPCLCGSVKCRGFLMRAKKQKKQSPANAANQNTAHNFSDSKVPSSVGPGSARAPASPRPPTKPVATPASGKPASDEPLGASESGCMQISTAGRKPLTPQKSHSIAAAAPTPLLPEMLLEPPEGPDRRSKSDEILNSSRSSHQEELYQRQDPQAGWSGSESEAVRQAEYIMRSSSEEEEDESDYSDDEEDPSIEMIE